MATVEVLGEQRVMFEEVSWEAYEALVKSWADLPVRMTYDHGRLEIMSPLLPHELYGALIAQIVETFTLEMRIPRCTGGSTTFKRVAKQRGLEPDECYWIQNEPRMRSRKEFDPERDPPPDLAIEVDITRSSLDRMSIYADLGVPEVWRFDGETLTIHVLVKGKRHETSPRSLALPALLPEVVQRFLEESNEMGEVELMRAFLRWVRTEVKGKKKPARKKPPRPRKK